MPSKRDERQRLNLVITPKSKERLERLMRVTEADTSAEVIRNALRFYEVAINYSTGEKEFLLRDKKTGETSVWEPFYHVVQE
jgi:hypothetical protein